MKKILKIAGIFLGGVIVGAILMNLLYMYGLPTYRVIIAANLSSDEEFKASRSRREGNELETVFHRWAVVNARSESGFRALSANNKEMDDDSFSMPFALLSFKWVFPPDKYKEGRQISEGIDRGKFAAALEAIGKNEEANKQWQLAAQMTRFKDIERTKKFIYSSLDYENTELYLKAEKKILGEPNQAQQKNRGDRE